HPAEELAKVREINDQLEMRKQAVYDFLTRNGKTIRDLDGVAARGGCVAELETGAYVIDDHFTELARDTINPHAANLAIMIANEIRHECGVPAYAYDLVCGTGKPEEVYTLSGMPEISRPFLTHVLNSRAVAFEQAKRDNTSVYERTYIVCHLGGGCSTNLLVNGTIRDLYGDDENCFTPERSGGVPCRKLVRMCYSGKYTEKEVQKLLKGQGGLKGYLGTTDIRDVLAMIRDGNEFAQVVFDAMVLQLAKNVGGIATVVDGKVDKIILTGGIAYCKEFTDALIRRVQFIAPVSVIPGTFEMEALAGGINQVLTGQEKARVYTGGPMIDAPSRSYRSME
ncbi:MAG: butyrate kinase, partial [Mogibacterium sp.]|nr:butyrate kinase [Mogibacterium sp.]